MGPLFPKVVPYEKQARLRLFGGEKQSINFNLNLGSNLS
jgi:hypothetical protein